MQGKVRLDHLRVEYGDILNDYDFVLQPVPSRKLKVRLVADRETYPSDFLEIRPILQNPSEQAKTVSASSWEPGVIEFSGGSWPTTAGEGLSR